MRPLNIDHNKVPPLALALIAGLLLFALAGHSHGPTGVKVTLHCPGYAAATAHHGRVRIKNIRGSGTTCAQVRRVLAVWFAGDLQRTGPLIEGFTCGIDSVPSLRGSTGGCRRSERAGVKFDIRFPGQR